MLLPDFSITQTRCDELVLKDITPAYSPKNTGGYGGPNPLVSDILWARVTITFGDDSCSIQLARVYNQLSDPWVIRAGDIPFDREKSDDCGCNRSGVEVTTVQGFLNTFPSGCITIRYQVYTEGEPCDTCEDIPHAGVKLRRFVSTCHEDKKFASVADMLTMPNATGCYDFFNTSEKRIDVMKGVMFAWTKLKLLEGDTGDCDCKCIAGRLSQINNYLDEVS